MKDWLVLNRQVYPQTVVLVS